MSEPECKCKANHRIGCFAYVLILVTLSKSCDIESKLDEANQQLKQIQERQILAREQE